MLVAVSLSQLHVQYSAALPAIVRSFTVRSARRALALALSHTTRCKRLESSTMVYYSPHLGRNCFCMPLRRRRPSRVLARDERRWKSLSPPTVPGSTYCSRGYGMR